MFLRTDVSVDGSQAFTHDAPVADLTVGTVIVAGPRRILVCPPGAFFSPEEAREMAKSLMTAADESERIASPLILPKGLAG